MACVGRAVLQRRGVCHPEGLRDFPACNDFSERQVAAGRNLGEADNVALNPQTFDPIPRLRPAQPPALQSSALSRDPGPLALCAGPGVTVAAPIPRRSACS